MQPRPNAEAFPVIGGQVDAASGRGMAPIPYIVIRNSVGFLGDLAAAAELHLGDPKLLRMTLGQAATHFGIIAPLSRRTTKSGARKRKQHEIEAGLPSWRMAAHG